MLKRNLEDIELGYSNNLNFSTLNFLVLKFFFNVSFHPYLRVETTRGIFFVVNKAYKFGNHFKAQF